MHGSKLHTHEIV